MTRLRHKDITATVSWCPIPGQGELLAAGSYAGSLDVNFESTSQLEIYSLDLFNRPQEGGSDELRLVGKVEAADRFHRLTWGNLSNTDLPLGLIAGGMADGTIQLWDPSLLNANEESVVAKLEKHTGSVKGLEFNPFQGTLLASAGEDAEVWIWNLQKLSEPTSVKPATTNPHTAEITHLQWNKKVQHILGSTSSNGLTVVWDLRQKKPVIRFNSNTQQNQQRYRCSALEWNPDVATQLALASDDDSCPTIQMWDLRKAYVPTHELSGHSQGILGMSWCPFDKNLLLSCGKDARTICWNPFTAETLCELPQSNNWVFDVQWSKGVTAVLSTCSFDGKVEAFSMQDASPHVATQEASDVFGTQEFGQQKAAGKRQPFKTAPNWLKRPVGVSFGFGGKLVTFTNGTSQDGKHKAKVNVGHIMTESDLATRTQKLEEALATNDLKGFCEHKIENSKSNDEKLAWNIMLMLLEEDSRRQLRNYLSFDEQDIRKQIDTKIESLKSADDLETKPSGIVVDQETDDLISRSILIGNYEAAVDLCVNSGRMSDALVLASLGGNELWQKTRDTYLESQKSTAYMKIVGSILTSDLTDFVANCDLTKWRETLAVLCTYASSQNFRALCEQLAIRLEEEDTSAATLCYMCAGNLDKTVQSWISAIDGDKASKRDSLQDFVEKISIFQRVTGREYVNDVIIVKYSKYAELLASQGMLNTALRYLDMLKNNMSDQSKLELYDRVYHAADPNVAVNYQIPPSPFQAQQQQQQQQQQAQLQFQQQQYLQQQQQIQQQMYQQQQQQLLIQQQQQMLAEQQAKQNLPQQFVHESGVQSTSAHKPTVMQNANLGDFELPPAITSQNTSQLQTTQRVTPVEHHQPTHTSATAARKSEEHLGELTSVDTSQVSMEYRAIISNINSVLHRSFSGQLSTVDLSMRDKIVQGLVILYKKLNANEINPVLGQKLNGFAHDLESKNFDGANNLLNDMTKAHWADIKNMSSGLKFLLQKAKKKN